MVKLGLVHATDSRQPNADTSTDTPKSAGIDIIFVHGLGSNPDKTWRAFSPHQQHQQRQRSSKQDTTKSVCWPTDLLPDRLKKAHRDRDRIWFYNYDSKWYKDAVHAELADFAKCMLHCIHDKLHPINGNSTRKLIFLCHSYGGLVVKEALLRAQAELRFRHVAERTKGVLFLGTPHRGTAFTNTGLILASLRRPLGSGTSMLLELKHHSQTLTLLNDKFLSLVMQYNIKTMDFFETKETKYLSQLPFSASLVVPKESAVMDESRPWVGLPLDHCSLNKFGEADGNFDLVVRGLMNIIQPLPRPVRVVPRRRIATYRARLSVSGAIDHFMSNNINSSTKVKPLVLHGLGGIGKSQLALDYIHRKKQLYDPVLWINAESTATIQSSFERCAKAMHLAPSDVPSSEGSLAENPSIEAVCQFLRQQDTTNDQWLMVFDNADHEKSFDIVEILPQGPCANVIVTSRHPHLAQFSQNSCERIHIKSMNPEESRKLVLSHFFPQDGPEFNDYDHIVHPVTEQLIDEITELLGHFPLALDLAARYMVAENFGLAPPANEAIVQQALQKYIDHFRDHKTEMLSRPDRSSEYHDNIRTVWDITLQGIERNNPDHYISDMLTLVALMDRSCIKDDIFRRASKNFGTFFGDHAKTKSDMPHQLNRFVSKNSQGDWDDYYYFTAKNKLVQYGLLELLFEDGSSASYATTMHSLVQWRAKERLKGTSWGPWLLVLFESIAHDILQQAETDTVFTGEFLRILYFAYESMEPVETLATASSVHVLRAWFTITLILQGENLYEVARIIASNILITARQFFGNDSLFTILSKDLLATLYEEDLTRAGDSAAQRLRMELRDDYERKHGPLHDSVIDTYYRVSLIYIHRRQFEKAKKIMDVVIDLRTKLHGIDHPATLDAFCNYAWILYLEGTAAKAEEILKNVYDFQSRKLGLKHPDTIPTREKLYPVLSRLKQYAESQIVIEGLLKQLRDTLPPDHEQILTLMQDMCFVLQMQGKVEEVEKLTEEGRVLCAKKEKRLRRGITD